VFERFTDRARRVLVLAQDEAHLLNHGFIGTEHILLGLIREGEGVAAKVLEQLDIQLEAVRERVEETIGLSTGAPVGSPPFTPRAKKVLELGYREALQLGHQYIGTEHILLGIVREGEGVGAQVLVSLGADLALVRQTVIRILSGQIGEPVSEARGTITPIRQVGEAGLVACSFCGRQPPETGQLVSGSDAYICEHCIRDWSRRLTGESRSYVQAAVHHVSHVGDVDPTGPPPEDVEAARAEIGATFAEYGNLGDNLSDDGQSVLSVERGENLGPTLVAAQQRNRHVVPEDAEVVVSVDEVVFIDQEHAAVWLSVAVDGRYFLRQHRGDAVVVEDRWKIARSTFCELMRLAGVECPPPVG
jgi:Clp amino terminal domain, pathogenicity island component/ClpX C4-type zinc finger